MIEQQALEAEVDRLLKVVYGKRFATLEKLTLSKLLSKNPYLYRGLGIVKAEEWVDEVLAAFISSSDETVFGNEFFEPLALWAAKAAEFPGDKREVTVGGGAGYDVGIETASAYRAVAIKSGKKIFNSQSSSAQGDQFLALQSRLKKTGKQFLPIIGYGYGRKTTRKESPTERLAGQKLWQLLTNEADFYLRIGQAIGKFAADHRQLYTEALDKKRNQLLRQFLVNFVDDSGTIQWDAILKYNSGEPRPARLKTASDTELLPKINSQEN